MVAYRFGNRGFAISFEDNLAEVTAQLGLASTWAVPYAAASALSKTAYDAAQAEKARILQVFDRPNTLTQRSVLYRKASKDNLTYTVFIRDEAARSGTAPEKYLEAEILSGTRRPKPFEMRLRSVGVLSSGEFAMPARGFPLDRFGNIPASVISSMISQLGARRDVGVMQNTTATSKARRKRRAMAQYFVPAPGSFLPRGVYERRPGHTVRAVLIFVHQAPTYSRRYAFGEAAIETANRVFPRYFVAAFERISLKGRR